MCGILFTKNINPEMSENALRLLTHRGPDGCHSVVLEDVFIGHTRLAVIDLSERSDQPFVGSDGKSIIIYNGEVYNFDELKKKYGLKTKTESDTEVVVELYIKLGADFLKELNGMFSIVIYNRESKDIFVARDRLGIKPLYIYQSNKSIAYSSEINPLLNLTDSQKPDMIGIRQYLKLRTFFRNHTLYEDIKSFPAGCYSFNGKIEKYWDIENCNSKFCNEELKYLIDSAIDYRKVSDVPMGSYLSGGLDSSIIASVSKNKDCWTIGFDAENEFIYSDLVANHSGLYLNKIKIDNSEFLVKAKELVSKNRVPLSVPNEVLLYKMTQEVRKKNTVVLSGEGADELFHGYDRIFNWASQSQFNLIGFEKHYAYGSHKDDEILNYVIEPLSDVKDNFRKISLFFQKYHLHGLLQRLDMTTMRCSVEARVPFVDHRLVEYMAGATLSFTAKNNIIKSPLKEIYHEILPCEVVNRRKVGFPVPLNKVFSGSEDAYDKWLSFNMEELFNDDWLEIKHDLLKEGIYV